MSVYEQLASIPIPNGAQFISKDGERTTSVQVTYTLRDQAQLKKRPMNKTIVVPQQPDAQPVAGPLLDSAFVTQLFSPSRSLKAVWRNVGEKRIVEVWKGLRLVVSADVTDFHGDFNAEEYITSFSWAPSERAIIYTAEGNAPKPPTGSSDYFQRFRYNPDFGEGLIGKRRPTTFVLSWGETSSASSTSAFRLSELKIKPGTAIVHGEPVRFAQVVFSPKRDDILYATGYEFTIDGRILGPRGCFNRPTGIWQLRLASSPSYVPQPDARSTPPKETDVIEVFANKLTPSHLSCRSPRVVPVGDDEHRLVFFASKTGGAHVSSSTLEAFDVHTLEAGSTAWDQQLPITPPQIRLMDIVNRPEENAFPGLYPDYNLPPTHVIRPSSSKDTYIAFSSHWGSKMAPLLVRVGGPQPVVFRIPDAEGSMYSWDVLGTDGRNKVVCSRGSLAVPPQVVVGTIDVKEDGSDLSVKWEVIDQPDLDEALGQALKSIQVDIVSLPTSVPTESIVVRNRSTEANGSVPPCITLPHGGPHATVTTAFSPMTTAFVLEGYTMNIPNYPGSPGYGQEYIDMLLGRCGELDLNIVMESVAFMNAQRWAEEGPGKHFIFGGSHGGFLGAHMLGAHPETFSGAVLRNPVISCGDISSTDIPDWYFAEFGFDYPLASSAPVGDASDSNEAASSAVPPVITPDLYAALTKASPVPQLEKIKAPVLLLLGANDKRVANTHGIEFYHALKGRGKPVEMLIFEGEGHGLDGVEVGRATFETTMEWFGRARK